MNDAHCHFFSTPFFAALGRQLKDFDPGSPEATALAKLGWDPPGTAEALADCWVAELDRSGVTRAVLIASIGARRDWRDEGRPRQNLRP